MLKQQSTGFVPVLSQKFLSNKDQLRKHLIYSSWFWTQTFWILVCLRTIIKAEVNSCLKCVCARVKVWWIWTCSGRRSGSTAALLVIIRCPCVRSWRGRTWSSGPAACWWSDVEETAPAARTTATSVSALPLKWPKNTTRYSTDSARLSGSQFSQKHCWDNDILNTNMSEEMNKPFENSASSCEGSYLTQKKTNNTFTCFWKTLIVKWLHLPGKTVPCFHRIITEVESCHFWIL